MARRPYHLLISVFIVLLLVLLFVQRRSLYVIRSGIVWDSVSFQFSGKAVIADQEIRNVRKEMLL